VHSFSQIYITRPRSLARSVCLPCCTHFSAFRRKYCNAIVNVMCRVNSFIAFCVNLSIYHNHNPSGRFVKQEQWERWRAKRKLVSGSKHRDASAGVRGTAVRRRRRAAAADILLTPPPIVTDRRAAAAAADCVSASLRRRFRDVLSSCRTPAICC